MNIIFEYLGFEGKIEEINIEPKLYYGSVINKRNSIITFCGTTISECFTEFCVSVEDFLEFTNQ
jgi:predicted HicB family RNase H-like nuclease